jgi:hypothetical protein
VQGLLRKINDGAVLRGPWPRTYLTLALGLCRRHWPAVCAPWLVRSVILPLSTLPPPPQNSARSWGGGTHYRNACCAASPHLTSQQHRWHNQHLRKENCSPLFSTSKFRSWCLAKCPVSLRGLQGSREVSGVQ